LGLGYTGLTLSTGIPLSSISPDLVQGAIMFLIALVLSIAAHEFGHAWMASRLGDPLPASQGRLTLNPVRHIEMMGTIIFPLIAYSSGIPLLGWGRPVQTNPAAYTRRVSRSTGRMLVAVAGPAMNLILMVATSTLLVVLARAGVVSLGFVDAVGNNFVRLNFVLFVFNLLPMPPLDGGSVLAWFLPPSMQGLIDFLQRWGMLILLGMMMTPLFSLWMVPALSLYDIWWHFILKVMAL
jgi:Zn-dependent protease